MKFTSADLDRKICDVFPSATLPKVSSAQFGATENVDFAYNKYWYEQIDDDLIIQLEGEIFPGGLAEFKAIYAQCQAIIMAKFSNSETLRECLMF